MNQFRRKRDIAMRRPERLRIGARPTRAYRTTAMVPCLLSVLFSAALIAAAGAPPAEETSNGRYRLPQNLMSHLQARYSRIDDVAVSSLQETPDGPLGRLNISGHMVPSAETTEESAEGRARATALAFMMEEAELLGIQSPAEFREIGLTSLQNGSTSVDYVRMVGDLQLLETQIRFDLDADGVITRVDATLRPVPEELLRAASRTTLSDEEVVRIVEEDLAWPEGGQAVEIAGAPQEYATWLPPFVIWAVAGSRGDRPAWSYTIDAFTGQVLSKNCTSRTISQVRSTTPCD